MAGTLNHAKVSRRMSGTAAREPIFETSDVTKTSDVMKELMEQRSLFENEKSKLLGKLDELKKQITEEKGQRETLTQQMKELTEENTALKEQIESHTQKIEGSQKKILKLEEELEKKNQDIEILQTRVRDLEEQEQTKTDQDILYISQAAFQFEKAICTYVLPKVFMNDQQAKIKDLLKYLHGKSDELPIRNPEKEPLPEARKRWDKVCEGLKDLPTIGSDQLGNFTNWGKHQSPTPDTMRAVYCLKKSRVAVAHPQPISLELVEKKMPAMKDKMANWQLELVKKFITSVKTRLIAEPQIYGKYFST